VSVDGDGDVNLAVGAVEPLVTATKTSPP